MTNPVEFGLAISNSHPSGTGSYTYDGKFHLVVENLAYTKDVSVWAQVGSGWTAINAHYVKPLSDNRELWTAPASNNEGQFVARYSVDGKTYWDNNVGKNYLFPRAFDEFIALPGSNYKVVLGDAGLSGGNLRVNIGVQNLAFEKELGIVYTTDHWATSQTAFATYTYTMESGLEIWQVNVGVGAATQVDFAIFYKVLGQEYWDNNFWANYQVTPTKQEHWADVN
jgi:hypothetical protein